MRRHTNNYSTMVENVIYAKYANKKKYKQPSTMVETVSCYEICTRDKIYTKFYKSRTHKLRKLICNYI